MGQVAGRFAQVEPRRRMRALVLGLLPDLPRKRLLAGRRVARASSPDGMQHPPGRARWDAAGHLAMLAHAFRAVVHAGEHARYPAPDGLILLTCNEIQRLFTASVRPTRDAAHRLHWSAWRRRHLARAQASHYHRQSRGSDVKIPIYGWIIS